MELHIHINPGNDMSSPSAPPTHDGSDEDQDGDAIRLDFSKLSKHCLTEIGYQLCLVCKKRYNADRESHVLPCGHHYCKVCLSMEVSRIKTEQPDKNGDKCDLPPSVF